MQRGLTRGLFRLWIVVSVAWMIGATIWLASEGAEIHRQTGEIGPSEGDTWFMEGFRSGTWIIIFIPPVLLLIAGAITAKATAWVVRGFRK